MFPGDILTLGKSFDKLPRSDSQPLFRRYKPADFQPNGSYRTISVVAEKDGKTLAGPVTQRLPRSYGCGVELRTPEESLHNSASGFKALITGLFRAHALIPANIHRGKRVEVPLFLTPRRHPDMLASSPIPHSLYRWSPVFMTIKVVSIEIHVTHRSPN